MSITELVRQLEAIVGVEHTLAAPDACANYRVQGRLPALVVAPGSREQLAQCVGMCHSARLPVVPWGGGTQQSWGWPPAAERFVVLQTQRLNRVLIYEPDDLTISVEAGITLAELDAALATNGQMLPLDAPLPARATVGGLLATASDGPRRLGYGTARDLLIGIGVVEATGRPSKAGGMVVKNVSGFDLMKLYGGSLGTLAIIVSANFKLLPRPRHAASVVCGFGQPAAAWALAEAIYASQLAPAAVEYLEGLAALAPYALAIRAEGLAAAVERHVRELTSLAAQHSPLVVQTLRDGEHAALWAMVNDLPQSVELAADELVLRLSCLPGDLARSLEDARTLAQRHGLALAIDARALSGLAYLRLRGEQSALAAWHAALLAAWPQLVVLAGPPELRAKLPIWGHEGNNLALMRRIRQEFDPDGLLNPGRYLV